MKTKGITIWEIHAEKMVLAVAIGVAGFLGVRQFIGQPNAVDIPGARVSPGEVDGLLEDEAILYLDRLADAARAELKPALPEPKLAFDRLIAGLETSLSPSEPFTLARVGWQVFATSGGARYVE